MTARGIVQREPDRAIQARPALQKLIDNFLAEQDVAKSSRATYRRELRQFVDWLEKTGRSSRMGELTRADILAYKEDLMEDLSPYTVSGYLVAVRKLFSWLESQKIYPNIAKDIKGAKKPRGFRKDTLTKGQLRDVLQEIERERMQGLRDYALINLMARTGLRTVEISRAKVGDIRQEAGQAVLWVQGKGRDAKDEFVLLTEETERPLRKWIQARRDLFGPVADDQPLFCSLSNRSKGSSLSTRSISRIVKKRLRAVGLDDSKLTAHSLRHTAITMAIQGGASLEQTQAMARHSDPKTTMIYYHNLNRIKAGAEKCISF